ncbi:MULTISPECIES: DUF4260 domain-containing protein [Flavobacteriaceae]|uniref:DUF4260 domain-containing protein n=1 Tax=Flavobacteriaceae TaxID=49546 RepID=UPI001491CF74|nr:MULTISPECIES: DUF4260 domain-containing protein [Allomuricauda]MDC6367683.1 DUF4260 domain-containing protein [Muricauda sp. AC10]
MKTLLKLEEVMMLLLGCYIFMQLDVQWWWFLVLILTPDIGMMGYLFGNKVGAALYNLFHHKGVGILLYLMGALLFDSTLLQIVGIIIFSHSAFDRALGYGLKYDKGFKYTHLGEIGKKDA